MPAEGHDFGGSFITAAAPSAVADGNTMVDVLVTLADSDGTRIGGWNVKLAATGTNNILNQPPNTSDANGQTQGAIGSTAIGMKTITMTPYQGSTNVLSPNNTCTIVFNLPPQTLRLTNVPSTVTAGQSVATQVTLYDANNNIVTDYLGTVALTSDDNRAVLPAPYKFTADDNGTATIPMAFGGAGTHSLTATDTVKSTLTQSVTGVQVNAGAAHSVAAQTSGTLGVGQPLTITLTATDAFGNPISSFNGAVHFSSTDPNATLPADYTFPGTNTATFPGVTLQKSGTQTITVTEVGTSTVLGVITVSIAPGPTVALQVLGLPASLGAGTVTGVTVRAVDSYGNLTPSYLGDIHFTSTDPNATLPTDYQYVGSDLGQRAFNGQVVFKSAGSQTLTATDRSNIGITGNSTAVNISVATLAAVRILGMPTTLQAGASTSIVVAAVDAYGNPITAFTDSVHFTSSDARAALPADYTYVTADRGVHTFTVAYGTVGTQSITVTDKVRTTLTAQVSAAVTGGAPSHISLSAVTTPLTVNQAFSLTVSVLDSFNNPATYTGTVQFSSNDGAATLPGAFTFTAGNNGVNTFNGLAFHTPGTRTVTVQDTVNALSATSNSVTVQPGPVANFSVTGFPTNPNVGQSGSLVVTALDSNNNVATNYTNAVTFSSTDTHAVLPARYNFTNGDQGVHTFSGVIFYTAGLQSITVTDTSLAVMGSQSGINVQPLPASVLVVSGPTAVTAGNANTYVVTAQDSLGNISTIYTGAVTFTTTDTHGTVPGNHTFTGANAGVFTFTATLDTAGNQNIVVRDINTASITGMLHIAVSAANANSITVTGLGASGTAGSSFSPIVTAFDAYNNVATGYTGTVQFTSSDGAATVPPNYQFVSGLDQGAHTFTNALTFKTVGNQNILVQDSNTASIKATSSNVAITASGVTNFVVSGLAATSTACTAQNFIVTAKDAYNNTVTGYTGTVQLSSSDANATLAAPHAYVPASDNGVHTFTGIVLKKAPITGVTVTATDTTNNITATQTVNTAAGNANYLTVTNISGPLSAGTQVSPIVTAYDMCANVATSYGGTVTFSSSDAQATRPANTAITNGTGTFTNGLVFKTVAASSTLTAKDTVTAAITGTSAGVQVTPGNANSFTVSGLPATFTACSAQTFTVVVKDAYANIVTGYNGTVTLSSTDANALFPVNPYTFVPATDNGTHAFTGIVLKKAPVGAVTVTATDSGHGLAATQPTTTVPGNANYLTLTGITGPATAGTALTPTVTAYDACANVATGYAGTITFSSTDSNATLPTNKVASSGVVTVASGVTFKTATASATATVTAKDTVTASLTITSSPGVLVNPGTVSSFTVAGIPSPVSAGANSNVVVTAHDAYNNLATNYTGTIDFSTPTDTLSSLPANYAYTGTDAGVHTFTSVALKTPASQQLLVTDPILSATGSETVNVVGATLLAAGGDANHMCINMGTPNETKCWGWNPSGELGLGDTIDRGGTTASMGSALPAVSLGSGRTATWLAAGGSTSCAVLDNSTVSCWGAGSNGQLGDGSTAAISTPSAAINLGAGRTALTAARQPLGVNINNGCALMDNGNVTCWGLNTSGQLGNGSSTVPTSSTTPVTTVALTAAGAAQAVSVGFGHTCVILSSGAVDCWGLGTTGQIGNNGTTSVSKPTATNSLGGSRTAYSLAAGYDHTCAILDNNTISCWGSQPGNGTGSVVKAPAVVTVTGATALKSPQALVSGHAFSCVITNTGKVACWGFNNVGQCGATAGGNITTASAVPFNPGGTGRTAVALSAGDSYACAQLDNGQVNCWGGDAQGQLGFGDTLNRAPPSTTAVPILW